MIITVIAHPGSKQPRVLEREPGVFDVYVADCAHDNKANEGIIEVMAEYFNVSKTSVQIVRGSGSKNKILSIVG